MTDFTLSSSSTSSYQWIN